MDDYDQLVDLYADLEAAQMSMLPMLRAEGEGGGAPAAKEGGADEAGAEQLDGPGDR